MQVFGAIQNPPFKHVCSQTGMRQSVPVHSSGQAHVFGEVQFPPLAQVWLVCMTKNNNNKLASTKRRKWAGRFKIKIVGCDIDRFSKQIEFNIAVKSDQIARQLRMKA